MRVVLPSPNGATLSLGASPGLVLAGCFRNAAAVAQAAQAIGKRVLLLPAGEQWPDSFLQPCQDLLGLEMLAESEARDGAPFQASADAADRSVGAPLARPRAWPHGAGAGRAASVGDRHLGSCDLGLLANRRLFSRDPGDRSATLSADGGARQALGSIEVRPLRYPTIVPMASLGRTGGGRMRIWTLASAAPSPHSPRSTMWNPALRAYVAISRTAPGNVAMAISYASPSWIWATDWLS